MKKFYFPILAMLLLSVNGFAQQRYLDEIFTNVTVTPNIEYAQNISVLTGAPTQIPLNMDIYQPTGDTQTERPLVIYLHTGSFLPILINRTATGSRTDSATAEMCRQFAKRGYVAASIDYRLGWNPAAVGAAGQDIRTGTLLTAVYRAIQDAKSCVRYFNKNYSTGGNTYKIDTSRIIICGQGSGGYVSLAYATVDKPSEISLLKFLSGTTDASYGYVAGQPYVNQAILGDEDGFGGIPQFNIENHVGFSSNVKMVVNMGGALGDSSWLEAGDVPMVCFHVTNDPFAPFGNGNVIVPTTGDFVVDVSGSQAVIGFCEAYDNNDVFNIPYTDPYTTRANAINGGLEGLFPFIMPDPGPPFYGQAGPWEWISYTNLQTLAPFLGVSSGAVDTIYQSAFFTNPNVDLKGNALNYIDTVQGYLAPRIVQALQLPGFYNSVVTLNGSNYTLSMYPNPAHSTTRIEISNNVAINSVSVFDITGRNMNAGVIIKSNRCDINTSSLSAGTYMIRLQTDKGEISSKLVKE